MIFIKLQKLDGCHVFAVFCGIYKNLYNSLTFLISAKWYNDLEILYQGDKQ